MMYTIMHGYNDCNGYTMTYIDDQDYLYFPYFDCGIESVLMVAEEGLYYTGC